MVPTVNDMKLTGPDGKNPWARAPNASGGYQLDGRFAGSAGASARRTAGPCAGPGAACRSACSTTSPPSSARCSPTTVCVRSAMRLLPAYRFLPDDADPPLSGLRAGGQGRVRAFLRPVSRRPWPIHHTGAVVRYYDILTRCPRPVDTRCRQPVSISNRVPNEQAMRNARKRMRPLCPTAPPCVASVLILAARCWRGLNGGPPPLR